MDSLRMLLTGLGPKAKNSTCPREPLTAPWSPPGRTCSLVCSPRSLQAAARRADNLGAQRERSGWIHTQHREPQTLGPVASPGPPSASQGKADKRGTVSLGRCLVPMQRSMEAR